LKAEDRISFSGPPRIFEELPARTRAICSKLKDELISSLGDALHGIYLYGAMVFPESKHVVDIDGHVILRRPLSEGEKESVRAVHSSLVSSFEDLTEEDLDIWYVLLEDVGSPSPPHHLIQDMSDYAWPLHRAHLLAGYCILLHGPGPEAFLTAPSSSELEAALRSEMRYMNGAAGRYPAYCVLNGCRIMYSYETGDVVISKNAAAEWAKQRYPAWKDLMDAALSKYANASGTSDEKLLAEGIDAFIRDVREVIGLYSGSMAAMEVTGDDTSPDP